MKSKELRRVSSQQRFEAKQMVRNVETCFTGSMRLRLLQVGVTVLLVKQNLAKEYMLNFQGPHICTYRDSII